MDTKQTDPLQQARKLLEGRLDELQREASAIGEALEGLPTGQTQATTEHRPPRATTPHRNAGTAKAKHGERQQQFLDYVAANPGSRVVDIARGMGVSQSQAAALAKKLAGRVTRRGKKYYPKGES